MTSSVDGQRGRDVEHHRLAGAQRMHARADLELAKAAPAEQGEQLAPQLQVGADLAEDAGHGIDGPVPGWVPGHAEEGSDVGLLEEDHTARPDQGQDRVQHPHAARDDA